MKFPIKDFFSKCLPNPQLPRDLVTFTEEIINGKLYFLYSVRMYFLKKGLFLSELDCFSRSKNVGFTKTCFLNEAACTCVNLHKYILP